MTAYILASSQQNVLLSSQLCSGAGGVVGRERINEESTWGYMWFTGDCAGAGLTA